MRRRLPRGGRCLDPLRKPVELPHSRSRRRGGVRLELRKHPAELPEQGGGGRAPTPAGGAGARGRERLLARPGRRGPLSGAVVLFVPALQGSLYSFYVRDHFMFLKEHQEMSALTAQVLRLSLGGVTAVELRTPACWLHRKFWGWCWPGGENALAIF